MSDNQVYNFNPLVFPSDISFNFVLMLITIPSLGISVSSIFLYALSAKMIPGEIMWFVYLFIINTLILLPSLAIYLYLTDSIRKIRQNKLEDLSDKYPEISDFVGSLCSKIGISSFPKTLWNKAETREALAFGTHKQTYMVVSDGLCKDFKVFPEIVEAIFLHELSHIKNKDISKHYLAEKICKSYFIIMSINLIVSIVYILIISPEKIKAFLPIDIVIYYLPGLAIFYLNGLIKDSREAYADFRAVSLQGTKEHLIQSIRGFPLAVPKTYMERIVNLAKSPLIPSVVKRIKYIEEPLCFFTPSFRRGFIAGIMVLLYAVAFFLYPEIPTLMGYITTIL